MGEEFLLGEEEERGVCQQFCFVFSYFWLEQRKEAKMQAETRQDYKNLIKSTNVASDIQKKERKRAKKDNFDRFKNFKRYYSLYNVINGKKKYPQKLREAAIKMMEKKHLRGVNEAVEGALDTQLELDPEHVRQLKRTVRHLREFKSLKKNPAQQRNHLVKNQKGGFLPLLIPIIAGIASSAIGEGVSAAIGAIKKKHHHHK